ncbi:transmembrane protein 272-like [Watersipora subatra]|uniref:transmembrane protein 272-like n=1 Tax=Watersipora subatra TaxID=2589382 RepID=UPI00355B5D18
MDVNENNCLPKLTNGEDLALNEIGASEAAPVVQQQSSVAQVDLCLKRTDVPPKYTRPTQGEEAPPPDYESIFGKVKKLKDESLDRVGCRQKAYSTFCSILMKIIGFLLFIGLPLVMLVLGVVFLNACPQKKMIPIYLVVAGATTTFYILLVVVRKLYRKWRQKGDEGDDESPVAKSHTKIKTNVFCNICDGIFTLFMISWFIAGNYYVYSAWSNSPECEKGKLRCKTKTDYCDPILLLFSFWLITGTYALCGCCTCFGICFSCIAACVKR